MCGLRGAFFRGLLLPAEDVLRCSPSLDCAGVCGGEGRPCPSAFAGAPSALEPSSPRRRHGLLDLLRCASSFCSDHFSIATLRSASFVGTMVSSFGSSSTVSDPPGPVTTSFVRMKKRTVANSLVIVSPIAHREVPRLSGHCKGTLFTQSPEESQVKELTSVETIETERTLRGVSEEGAGGTRGETDKEDEGDGGGREGDGTRGMGMGEEDPLGVDGESRGNVDELLTFVATESKVV